MNRQANQDLEKYHEITSQDDIRKLHAEIQQLRNQQFTLGTLALTAFGLSSWIFPRFPYGPNQSALYSYATVALTSILWLMLRWSKTLWILTVIISKYLELRGLSEWEKDFRSFIRKNNIYTYRSQSKAVAAMYLMLGIFVGLSYYMDLLGSGRQILEPLNIFVSSVLLAYITYAVRFLVGRRVEAPIEERWKAILSERFQDYY
jgi:hypothetical protein